MAKDQRLYGKLSLDFPDHPKIAILSDAAFRCLVEATLWSRKQETDGFLARRLATRLWSLDALLELTLNDGANPSLIERPEGWYVHDYAAHQDTKAEIEARRTRNKLAGQKGGLAKSKQVAKQNASKSLSENLAEEEEEEEKEKEKEIKRTTTKTCATASRSATPPHFEDFWSVYPRRRDRRKAEKAFANALKRAAPDVIIAGAARYRTDPNRTEQFTKYAEGWLNGDGWLDEPLPTRNGRDTHPPHKMRVLAELAQTVRAAENAHQLTTADLKELQ